MDCHGLLPRNDGYKPLDSGQRRNDRLWIAAGFALAMTASQPFGFKLSLE